jgi:hypothetical protein
MSRRTRLIPHDFSIEKVTTIQGINRIVRLCLICLFATPGAAQVCRQWNEPVQIGQLSAQLEEASGVASSRQFERLYHVNDSGSAGNFFITAMDGSNTQSVRIAGFDPLDAEALSMGPCPGSKTQACIYVADIGDNSKNRKAIEIIAIDEVENFRATAPVRSRIQLRYPDEPHDAESMAVHPDGTIFILTKERPAKLFKAKPEQRETTLSEVTSLDTGSPPTDIAISDDGSRLLVLTYAAAYEYGMDFKQQQKIPIRFLQQQESITYLRGSRSFIYTTERLFAVLPQWIMRMDCDGRE